jgi:hypothetical protein
LWDNAVLFAKWNGTAAPTGGVPQQLLSTFDPFPPGPNDPTSQLGSFLSSSLMGFYSTLGFVTIPAIQAVNVVMERENKSKQLQMIMGAGPFSYWVATWLYVEIRAVVHSLQSVCCAAGISSFSLRPGLVASLSCMQSARLP